MHCLRPLVVQPKMIVLSFLLLLPAPIFAQVPTKNEGGQIFVATDALDPHNARSLAVQIRDSNGSKLDKLALVTIYKFSGQALSSRTTSGSQAIFGDLGAGAYYVDVEALGMKTRRLCGK
jgi:hypothetical protein